MQKFVAVNFPKKDLIDYEKLHQVHDREAKLKHMTKQEMSDLFTVDS
jgi:hypothetical protein